MKIVIVIMLVMICNDFARSQKLQKSIRETEAEIGQDLTSQKKYSEALPHLKKAEVCGFKGLGFYFSLGRAYLEVENYNEAIKYFDILDKTYKSTYAWVYCNRGNAYRNLKRYSEAMNDYNRAISLYESEIISQTSDSWLFYRNRGLLNLKMKQYDDAEGDYFAAIDESPFSSLSYLELIEMYAVKKDYKELLAFAQECKDVPFSKEDMVIFYFYMYCGRRVAGMDYINDERMLINTLQSVTSVEWNFEDFRDSLKQSSFSNRIKKDIYTYIKSIEKIKK